MDRNLFLPPIGDSPQRVIDIGTGTGIWAIDFADAFPSAEVIGNDLSPTKPTLVPPNVRFLVDDIEDEWGYEREPFDFIHARYLTGSIKDFPKLLGQYASPPSNLAFGVTMDWDAMPRSEDGTLNGTAVEEWYTHVIGAFDDLGIVTRPGEHLETWFKDAGFVDVHVQAYRIPWPKNRHLKKVGTWCLLQSESAYEGSAMAVLTRFKNWTPEQVKDLCDRTMQDSRNPKIHALFDFYVVYGRKPE